MKPLICNFILLILLAHCSTRKMQESSVPNSDSTLATYTEFDSASGEFNDDSENNDSLLTSIGNAVDDIASAAKEKSLYSLRGTFAGHENSADATYFFDATMSLTYCTVKWGSEMTSGSFEYYFINDSLVAGLEENAYNDFEESVTLHTKFHPIYGYSTTNGTEDDSGVTYLGEADYYSRNSDSLQEYNRLLNRIREYQDSVSTDGEYITIHLENVVNYGEDFLETEDFRISKSVFENIIKD